MDVRQHQNPGSLMEVEQSVLAVELEPTDHVCVLLLLLLLSRGNRTPGSRCNAAVASP